MADHGRLRLIAGINTTAGKNPTEVADFLFCSRSSVYRAVNAYRAGELDWQREDPGASPRLSRWQRKLRSLIKLSPRVFGWCRVRWSCAALAVTLAVLTQVEVSRETVRLELKVAGYVWKRAKLKARDSDPERAKRLARIRLLIEQKGAQIEVPTPGKNQKHYLAAHARLRV